MCIFIHIFDDDDEGRAELRVAQRPADANSII